MIPNGFLDNCLVIFRGRQIIDISSINVIKLVMFLNKIVNNKDFPSYVNNSFDEESALSR